MKKILLLLLLWVSGMTAQVSTGNEFVSDYGFKSDPAQLQIPSTVNYVGTVGTDGTSGKVLPGNVTINTSPVNFAPATSNLSGYFSAIDTRLGQIGNVTAGVTTRVHLTGDNITVTAGTFFASNTTGKGATAAGTPQQTLSNNDDQKQYFTKDVISVAVPALTTAPPGVYSGQLTVTSDPTPGTSKQRFTIEIYKTNNGGTPIASGITGAPVGDLGVTVVAILDSGLINVVASALTNIGLQGNLASTLTLNTGERLRYHVSAEKVGTDGGAVIMNVYYGTNYNSYYDIPVTFNTDGILNKSTVSGINASDALNTLKTVQDSKLNKTYESNFDVADNTSTISGSTFDAFGILVQTLSNKLISIYREGAGHTSDDGKIVMRTSTDGGKTFSSRSIIHQDTGIDCRNLAGGVTPSGRIIIFFLKATNTGPTFISQGTIYSDDDGVTWSGYTAQTVPVGNSGFSPYGNMIAIADNKLALPYYAVTPTFGAGTYLKFSSDNGNTWGNDVLVGSNLTNGYNEASYAYLDGGVIVGISRNVDTTFLRQFLSTDNGATWTDQGNCGLSESGLISPWLNVYRETDGEKYVSLFYTAKAVVRNILAISASRTSILAGASGWIPETKKTVVTGATSGDFGYPTFVNPRFGKKMLGMYYICPDSSNPLSAVANYNFFNYQPSAIYYKAANTGIGTNNPNYKTHIHSGASNNYISLTNNTTGSAAGDGFLLGVDMAGAVQIYNRENTAIQIATNNSESVRIHPSSGVSVGNTTDPGATNLSVTGSARMGSGIISTTPTTSAGTDYDLMSRNKTTGVIEKVPTVLVSGNYTPTITGTANTTTATGAGMAVYTRVGNIITVTVSIQCTVPAITTQSSIDITLPVNRVSINTIYAGSGALNNTTAPPTTLTAKIPVVVTINSGSTTTATCYFNPTSTSNTWIGSVTFQYFIN